MARGLAEAGADIVIASRHENELRAALEPSNLNLKSIFARLEKHGDLWKDFWRSRQSLDRAIELLGRHVAPKSKR